LKKKKRTLYSCCKRRKGISRKQHILSPQRGKRKKQAHPQKKGKVGRIALSKKTSFVLGFSETLRKKPPKTPPPSRDKKKDPATKKSLWPAPEEGEANA